MSEHDDGTNIQQELIKLAVALKNGSVSKELAEDIAKDNKFALDDKMGDDDLIGGIFTEEFCKKLYEKMHSGDASYRSWLRMHIARKEAWEMMRI